MKLTILKNSLPTESCVLFWRSRLTCAGASCSSRANKRRGSPAESCMVPDYSLTSPCRLLSRSVRSERVSTRRSRSPALRVHERPARRRWSDVVTVCKHTHTHTRSLYVCEDLHWLLFVFHYFAQPNPKPNHNVPIFQTLKNMAMLHGNLHSFNSYLDSKL